MLQDLKVRRNSKPSVLSAYNASLTVLSNLLREGDAHSWTEEFQLAFEESKRLFDDKCLDNDDLQET